MKTINQHVKNNGRTKQWVANQLGISSHRLSKLINSSEGLISFKKDKLKVEKFCQIFNCTPEDIDFDNV